MAKIGRLVLNKGNWEGKQIVDSAWVEQIYVPAIKDNNNNYSLGWYNFTTSKTIYAHGLFGQCIVVYPKYNIVAVRLGENKWNEYEVLVRNIIDQIENGKH